MFKTELKAHLSYQTQAKCAVLMASLTVANINLKRTLNECLNISGVCDISY